jgi:hypothetical protein
MVSTVTTIMTECRKCGTPKVSLDTTVGKVERFGWWDDMPTSVTLVAVCPNLKCQTTYEMTFTLSSVSVSED